jgi:hypothetical protein
MKCPDCHQKIVFGTEHLGGCRYLTLRPKELKRTYLRNKLGR